MERLLRSKEDYYSTILRNQLTSLILFESLKTTKSKASRLESYANHFYNKVRSADLNAKKLAHRTLFNKNAILKLFEEILPRYKHDETTFARTINMAPRAGDNAKMALIMITKPLEVKLKETEKKETVKAKTRAKK